MGIKMKCMIRFVGTHAINASLYSAMPYDNVKDFEPVSLVAMVTIVLVVHPSIPASSVKELIVVAKSRPGELTFGSPGNGTPQHLAGELFNTMAGVKMVHIPYKGAVPALTDLLGGRVSLIFSSMPPALPHVKAGKLKALAVTSARRSFAAPNIPTIAESGLPGYEVINWYGIRGNFEDLEHRRRERAPVRPRRRNIRQHAAGICRLYQKRN